MDTNKEKRTEQQTNTETIRWKLPEYRKNVVQKCIEGVTKQGEWKDWSRLSGLVQHLERFEARVNAAAKSEVEYIQWLSEKIKAIAAQLRTGESKPHLSDSTGSGEISAQEAGKYANIEWKEQVYQKAQRMNSTYFPKLYGIYQQISRQLKQLESSPQEANIVILEKKRRQIKSCECIFTLLRVSKSQITTELKENLDKAEKFLQKNFSSNRQGQQHSTDVQSSQQSGPSHSCIRQMKILETKPSLQALGTQNKYTMKDVSQKNKMSFQEQKSSPQALGTWNYHTKKDVSLKNKMCLQEQKPSPQALRTQNYHTKKDVLQQNKMCLQEPKPSPQALGTRNYHTKKDVSQQNKMSLQEQKSSPQALGIWNYHTKKDVSQQNKMCLQEQKSSPQALGTQNNHMKKDVSPQNKMCLQEQKPSPQALEAQNYHMMKGVSKQNKIYLQEQKPSLQALGTQKNHTMKDVSQQKKMCLQEWKPSPQALGTQNYHMVKEVSQQNKMCLQDQKVAKQYSNSQEDVNPLSIIKGPGNGGVQQQVQGAQKATEAFSVSVNIQGISASPLIENSNNLKDISCKHTFTSDESSPAMQRFLKVLTSISPEALSASVGEIREVVYLDDVIPTSELINGPQTSFQQQNPPSLIPQTSTNLTSDIIDPCSQARYVSCNDFVPTRTKRPHSMNELIAFDTSGICASSLNSFNQLTDAEKPELISVTPKIKHPRIVENCSLLEEIKEINNLLIDSEVVIGEKDIIQSAAGGAAEHGEGLVIKFLFNAVTVNQDLISHLSDDKKSIIKPLWLLVPTNYPFSPPVILDQMLSEVSSVGLKDLSTIAKSKLRYSLQCLNQPWSLRAIAKSWERCAREAILESAQGIGGGTFSPKYGGGWEMCQTCVKKSCNISPVRFV